MDIETAANILGIKIPTEFRLVKSAFRRLAMICHPDVGGDADKFRDIENAYRTLENNPDALRSSDEIINATVDGVMLSDLGKGYLMSISARTCNECEGRGYRILKEPRWVKCSACHGTGWKHVPCKRCNGLGRSKKGDKRKWVCPSCGGSGEFVPHDWAEKKKPRSYVDMMSRARAFPLSYYCDKCNGSGSRFEKVGKSYAVKCDLCKGIGEIKMFNPVLPRGLLT